RHGRLSGDRPSPSPRHRAGSDRSTVDAVRPVADPARLRPVSSTTSKEDIMTRSLFSASSIAPVSRPRAGRLAVLAAAATLALAGCAPAAAAPETPAASS